MKRYIINYRDEFSCVVEAENANDAMHKAQTQEQQWECVGELHRDFFEHETDHLTADEYAELYD